MNPEIERRRQNRTAFLVRLYEIVDASVSTFVSGPEIATGIGVTYDARYAHQADWEEKQYIHIIDHKLGIVRITALGIDHVEAEG